MDWKNKYWRNVNTTQRSPHIICSTNHIAPALFSKLEQAIIKCVWKHKRLRIAKVILKKKTKVRGTTMPDFSLYQKAITIKTAWYGHRHKYIDLMA